MGRKTKLLVGTVLLATVFVTARKLERLTRPPFDTESP